MRGDYAGIAAHDLDPLELCLEGAALVESKALRPYADPDCPVGRAGNGEHVLSADEEAAALNLALEYVDSGRSEELGDEEIGWQVVYVLRLTYLLQNSVLHDHDEVGDAHGLLLIVGDEYSRYTRLVLYAADLLTGLEAEAGVEVRQRLVEQKNARHFYEGAGDGDALLLAAGEL